MLIEKDLYGFSKNFSYYFREKKKKYSRKNNQFQAILPIYQSSLSMKIMSIAYNLTLIKAKAFILKDECIQR